LNEPHAPDLSGDFINVEAAIPSVASDFRHIPLTALIAGGQKLDQLLGEPAQTFHASLIRHVYEAEAILIGGYGFGDTHVNRALQNRFARNVPSWPGHPRVAVLTKTTYPQPLSGGRPDLWAQELKRSLRFLPHPNSNLSNPPQISPNMWETDAGNRVKIWHDGFVEAVDCLGYTTKWLQNLL
jgi:hypothetical protein